MKAARVKIRELQRLLGKKTEENEILHEALEIARLLSTHGHRFAKTNSRPVTGSMNDHVQNSRWYIEQDGGLKVADVDAINRRLNRTAMGALAPGQHMDFPIEVLTRIIRPSGAA